MMNHRQKRPVRLAGGGTVLLTALLVVGTLGACTSGTVNPTTAASTVPGQVRNFTLYVRDNTLTMPDGKKIYVFGYTDNPNGHAQIPGPTLTVNEGDTVNLTLVNDKDPTKTAYNPTGDGHTIHLHGLDLPSAMDGDPMTAPSGHAVMQGSTYTYHFVAAQAGTYWYHCHEDAAEHIQMGMYGAFIILPNGDSHRAYANTPTFDKQYTFVLSEMQSAAHAADYNAITKGGASFNWSLYQPDYFLINGLAWPAVLKDPASTITATIGQRVLIRLINAGYTVHSMHLHGFHFQVIASDGRKLPAAYEKDTLLIGPGERYDILVTLNQAGRYMFHDHIEQNTTNNGIYPGGMITMVNVNNTDGSNPVQMIDTNNAD